jgi:Tfp pilus assembly ATPase PilU
MNFSHYHGLVETEKVKRFIFVQGNRPAAELIEGQIEYLSETFLFKEDMLAILSEIESSLDPDAQSDHFFLDGKRFSFKKLILRDSMQITVKAHEVDALSWSDMQIPGYLNDWLEAKSGLLIFYGSDVNFVESIRMAFSQKRAETLEGSSLVFMSEQSAALSSPEKHFLTASCDEETFLQKGSHIKFGSYSFQGDLLSVGGQKALKTADQGSLVIVNSFWSDIAGVWSDIFKAFDDENFRNLFFENVVGFVGVKEVEAVAQGPSSVVFEVLPMPQVNEIQGLSFKDQVQKVKKTLKTDGVSFNQSIHSLVIKRKMSLDDAYKASPDPEELNQFLSESGV